MFSSNDNKHPPWGSDINGSREIRVLVRAPIENSNLVWVLITEGISLKTGTGIRREILN